MEEKVVKPKFSEQQKKDSVTSDTNPTEPELIPVETAEKLIEQKPQEYYQDMLRRGDLKEGLEVKVHWSQDPTFFKLSDYFSLTPDDWLDNRTLNQLDEVHTWAVNETKSHKAVDLLEAISKLERKLPTPGMHERRLAIVRRYIRLLGQKSDVDRELKIYEKPKKRGGEKK